MTATEPTIGPHDVCTACTDPTCRCFCPDCLPLRTAAEMAMAERSQARWATTTTTPKETP